ncbi:N- methylation [Arcobacter sp. 31_11_sub10_T18]|nr:N- methylation [Arcobacter sp. 31_11_sub10_T18]
MEENKRNLFALNGITGMLIATALLISILVVLTYLGLSVQQNEASNFYEIKNAKDIKTNSVDNAKHYNLKGSK